MYRCLVSLCVAFLAGCASTSQIPSNYAGADAGKVVLGLGAMNAGAAYSSYDLRFRRVDGAQTDTATNNFSYLSNNVFSSKKPDYQDAKETGVVIVKSLPAGKYEIINFNIFLNMGMTSSNFSSRAPFSIPFTVKAGQVTYLGNYQANKTTGKNTFGMEVPTGAVFAISQRQTAEVAIARGLDAALPATVEDSAPAAASINSQFFVQSR